MNDLAPRAMPSRVLCVLLFLWFSHLLGAPKRIRYLYLMVINSAAL